jgi:hypothetical protein
VRTAEKMIKIQRKTKSIAKNRLFIGKAILQMTIRSRPFRSPFCFLFQNNNYYLFHPKRQINKTSILIYNGKKQRKKKRSVPHYKKKQEEVRKKSDLL